MYSKSNDKTKLNDSIDEIKKFIVSIEDNSDPRKDIYKKAIEEKWTLLTMSKTTPKLEDVFKFLTIGDEKE